MKKLLQVDMLVETRFGTEEEANLPEITRREVCKPAWVRGYIPINKILEFHSSIDFPYETRISLRGGDMVIVQSEIEEFAKQYESAHE